MDVLDAFRLDGRTAIVTGGNRGIGRALAEALADVGANVAIANRDAESGERATTEIAEATGAETLAVPADVSDADEVAAMVEEVVEAFGGIDVLVNNAGVVVHEAAEDMTVEEFERVLDVNLTGVFRCSREVGRRMIDDGGGSIVNVSSMSAFVANYPQRQVGYNASKAGVEGFTTQLASEWAEHGIRVNTLAPGYIRTEMVDEGLDADPESGEIWFDEMLLEEMARPEDLGPAVVFLASDASWYMTGATLLIDGGYTVR